MTDLYILSNSNCISCLDSKGMGRYLNNGKPYGDNVFKIIDSFDPNSVTIGATNFFGYSLAEYGYYVYKKDGNKVELQKTEFANLDTLYLTRKNDKWMLGV